MDERNNRLVGKDEGLVLRYPAVAKLRSSAEELMNVILFQLRPGAPEDGVLGRTSSKVDNPLNREEARWEPFIKSRFPVLEVDVAYGRTGAENDRAGRIRISLIEFIEVAARRKTRALLTNKLTRDQQGCQGSAARQDTTVLVARQAQLTTERDQFRTMFEVTRALVKPSDLRELFVRVSTILRTFVQDDYAGLALYEDDSNHLRLCAMDFPNGKGVIREDLLMPRTESLCGTALNSGIPMLLAPLSEELAFDLSRLLLAEGLKSACFIPLAGSRGPIGTLNLGSVRANAFSPDHVHVLSEIRANAWASRLRSRNHIVKVPRV